MKKSDFNALTHSVDSRPQQSNEALIKNKPLIVNKSKIGKNNYCLLSKDSTGDSSFTLNTVFSNCSEPQEINIKSFMLQKILKNTIYKTGSFGVLDLDNYTITNDLQDNQQSPVNVISCFYTLLEVPISDSSSSLGGSFDIQELSDNDLDLDMDLNMDLDLDLNFSNKSIDDLINDKDEEDNEEFIKQLNITPPTISPINTRSPTYSKKRSSKTTQNKEYYLCLICETENDVNLGMFHLEFSYYCELLISYLKINNNSEIEKHLSNWYTFCIEYISRTVQLLNEDLQSIIHSALNGYSFQIKSPAQDYSCLDLIMFIKTLSFVNQSHKQLTSTNSDHLVYFITPSENNNNENSNPEQIIEIELVTGDQKVIKCNYTESNLFCKKWSMKYLDNLDNPLLLRNFSEDIKLRVIQELNLFRRMIDHSKLNNYLLYKSFVFLSADDNNDILLNLFQKDNQSDPSVNDIIIILKKQLQKSVVTIQK
ncbi:hypothetical protein DLAC_11002 [Tieghemostelium lacteum]|uniref:Uncharacterized protein n=1 Tax=Tieghemostelium lacteum TaxID=361077 RepID=A0A151Z2X1_TIELA|nr:hypothetical protein DLAC_11002 [Tieghemostelium lacteum]|eukprot:KYQ88306.1 hypothetical protein DLAC_11002 [Tieghemostelium lacteum]